MLAAVIPRRIDTLLSTFMRLGMRLCDLLNPEKPGDGAISTSYSWISLKKALAVDSMPGKVSLYRLQVPVSQFAGRKSVTCYPARQPSSKTIVFKDKSIFVYLTIATCG
jgi:hypothetical protein